MTPSQGKIRRPPWRDPTFQLHVEELLDRGLTIDAVGKQIGQHRSTVHKWVSRLGLDRRQRANAIRVSERLGVHVATLRDWIEQGIIRAPIVNTDPTRRYRHISEANVLAFLENRQYWHLWEPAAITDRALREWATELRQEEGELLTTKAIARRYGVRAYCVREWIHAGHIPARKVGVEWLIDPADLATFTPPMERPRTERERAWTDDERRLLIAWRLRGCRFTTIAGRLGRTSTGCRSYYNLMRKGRAPMPTGYQPSDLPDADTANSRRGAYEPKVYMNDTERAQLYARWQAGDYRNIYDAGRAWGISHETARTIINAGLAADGKPAPGKGRRANRAA